jgi:hypothetical protein
VANPITRVAVRQQPTQHMQADAERCSGLGGGVCVRVMPANTLLPIQLAAVSKVVQLALLMLK